MIVPIEGGQPRELLRLQAPQAFAFGLTVWTPDSRSILFGKNLSSTGQETELWLAPLDGGQLHKIDLNLKPVMQWRFSPKGNEVAFGAGDFNVELWVLENFLPTHSASK